MNNDPPEEYEPPEWWMALEEALELPGMPQGVEDAIRKAMDDWQQELAAAQDIGPPGWEVDEHFGVEHGCRNCGKPTTCVYCSEECTPDCPHGNRPGDCDYCDHLGDLAYDAARESR